MTNEVVEVLDTSSIPVDEMFGKILQERISAGVLENAMREKIDSMLVDVVNNTFRTYGDINKALQQSITDAITPNLKELSDLPSYHDFVMKNLKAAAIRFQDEQLQKVLDKEMEEIFAKVPDELTLSWIVSQIGKMALEEVRDNGEDYDDDMTLIIEVDSARFTNIYISKTPNASKYKCEYRIGLSKGEIFVIAIDNEDAGKSLSVGPLYSFEKILFNAYAMKSKLILDNGTDADDYDTYVCSDNY